MSTLARVTDFIPGQVIVSSQVDAEFNQIVNLLNGTSTDKNSIIVFSDATIAGLSVQQLGAGPIVTFLGLSDTFGPKAAISSLGLVTSRAVISATETADLISHGGVLKTSITSAGNATTVETDLFTYTCPANLLANVGDSIEFEAGMFGAANANTKTIRVYFGGTVLATHATTVSDRHFIVRGMVQRISASAVRSTCMIMHAGIAGAAGTVTSPATTIQVTALTFSGTLIFKITGQSGTASNDVVFNNIIVKFWPNRQ